MTEKSKYTKNKTDQLDWNKGFGSKSGIKTKENLEEIAVYRWNKKPEYALYIRQRDKFVTEQTDYEVLINLKHWIPVFPWSGGNVPSNEDFSYEMKIKKFRLL